MTVGNFRNLVWSMAQRLGTPYIAQTDETLLNALLQEGLNVYAKETLCLQASQVIFTPTMGQSIYVVYAPSSGSSTCLSFPNNIAGNIGMCSVDQVYLNGSPLMVADSRYVAGWIANPRAMATGSREFGESSEEEVIKLNPSYLMAASGLPQFWFQKSPNLVVFSCPFDQAYTNSWFAGCLYHTPIGTADTQVLDIPDEDVRPAARVCRNLLLEPLNPELVMPLMAASTMEMKKRRSEATSRYTGNARRTMAGDEWQGVRLTG